MARMTMSASRTKLSSRPRRLLLLLRRWIATEPTAEELRDGRSSTTSAESSNRMPALSHACTASSEHVLDRTQCGTHCLKSLANGRAKVLRFVCQSESIAMPRFLAHLLKSNTATVDDSDACRGLVLLESACQLEAQQASSNDDNVPGRRTSSGAIELDALPCRLKREDVTKFGSRYAQQLCGRGTSRQRHQGEVRCPSSPHLWTRASGEHELRVA